MFYCVFQIWNHPDILYFFLKKRSLDEAEIDLDLEETGTPLGTPLAPSLTTSPSSSKRSRNRSKGGGVNPNSKEFKVNCKVIIIMYYFVLIRVIIS